jgi:hypothetical protein
MTLPESAGHFQYVVTLTDQQGRPLRRAASAPFTIRPVSRSATVISSALDVSVRGSGTVVSDPAGISCQAGSCRGIFPFRAAVVLTALPAAGRQFTGWGGDCAGLGISCRLRVGHAASVSAEFRPRSRYFVTRCGSIVDNSTGLEWFVGPDVNTTWTTAVTWVRALQACGTGWRLPTDSQLKGLYSLGSTAGTGYSRAGQHCPARIDPAFRAIGGGSWVWTSKRIDASHAVAVNLYENVDVPFNERQTEFPVRVFAVRVLHR